MSMSDAIGDLMIVIRGDGSSLPSDVEKSTGALARVGDNLAQALLTPLKLATATTGAIIAGLLTTTLTSGMGRLVALDNATAKMKGLGVTGQALDAIMAQVNKSVLGTSFSLGEAANAAALMMTSGVQAGDQMDSTLGAIVATAAAAGTSLDEISSIWMKVASAGKVSGYEIRQLSFRGINALDALAQHFGITRDQAQQMVTDGKVSFDDFNKAMTSSLGEMAAAMGNTFEGMRANLRSGLARVGAEILAPLFEASKLLMPALLDLIRPIPGIVSGIMEPIAARLIPAAERLAERIASIDADSGFVRLMDQVNRFGAMLLPLAGLALGVLGPFLKTLPLVGGLFSGLTGPVGLTLGLISLLISKSPELRAALGNALETIGGVLVSLTPLWEALSDTIEVLAPLIGTVLAQALDLVTPMLADLATTAGVLLAGALEALQPLLQWLSDILNEYPGIIQGIVGAFVAWKVASAAIGAIRAVMLGVTAATYGTQGAMLVAGASARVYTATMIAQKLALLAHTAVAKAANLASLIGSQVRAVAAWIAHTAAIVANRLALLAMSAVSKAVVAAQTAMTIAQRLFNAALSANPIGLVITAITLLVGALVWFFTQTELGQRIFTAAWSGIQAAAQAVAAWFTGPFLDFWRAVWDGIVGVWNAIYDAVATAIGWVRDVVTNVVSTIIALWTGYWNLIFTTVSAVWNWIVTAVSNAIDFVRNVVVTVVSFIVNLWTTYWNTVLTVARTVWSAIQTTVSTIINAVRNTIQNVVQTIQNIWNNIWNAIRNAFSGIWNGIRDAATTGVNNVYNTVVGIRDRVLGFFANAGTWLRDSGRKLIQGLVDGISGTISRVTDAVGNVMSAARNLMPFSPAKEGPFSGPGWTLYSGRSIMQAMAKGVLDEQDRLVNAVDEVMRGAHRQFDIGVLPASVVPALPGGTGSPARPSEPVSLSPGAALSREDMDYLIAGIAAALWPAARAAEVVEDFARMGRNRHRRGVRSDDEGTL